MKIPFRIFYISFRVIRILLVSVSLSSELLQNQEDKEEPRHPRSNERFSTSRVFSHVPSLLSLPHLSPPFTNPVENVTVS